MSLFLFALVACDAAGTDSADTAGDTGDGPVDADELPWTGECPAASGFADGASFEYVYNATWEDTNDRAGGWTVEVAANGDGTYEVITSLAVTGSNNAYEEVSTAGYGCDADGLWLLTQRVDFTTTVYEPYTGFRTYTYDAPILIMPATVQEGSWWESVYGGTYENEVGQRRSADNVLEWEVMAAETVETPAGSWNAMNWVQTTATGLSSDYWYVSGLGMVANQDADLVDYQQ